MTARIRWGLIAGVIGLLVNTLASLVFAICGPIISFGIGLIAGYFVAEQEPAPSKGEGAQGSAITGLISGSFILIGQILGAAGSLVLAQSDSYRSLFGTLPGLSSPEGQAVYWIVGVGVGVCFGLIDTLACVFGAALAGYLRTPDSMPLTERSDDGAVD